MEAYGGIRYFWGDFCRRLAGTKSLERAERGGEATIRIFVLHVWSCSCFLTTHSINLTPHPPQYVLFNVMLPRFSPMPTNFFSLPISKRLCHASGLKAIAVLTVVENAINQPFLHFPSLYFIKHKMVRKVIIAVAGGVK